MGDMGFSLIGVIEAPVGLGAGQRIELRAGTYRGFQFQAL